MSIEKIVISRDDDFYHAWPDLALSASGRLVVVFTECRHHLDRSYTCIYWTISDDAGASWSPRKRLTEPRHRQSEDDPYWDTARITALRDGRLAVVVNEAGGKGGCGRSARSFLWISEDDGITWNPPELLPGGGIVPDQLVELRHSSHAGRWHLADHFFTLREGVAVASWTVEGWYSDDRGKSWHGPRQIACEPGLKLCEASILETSGGELVCFLRENSNTGDDAYKSISRDGGLSWGPVTRFPLPGCHRPVAGRLASGRVLITYRFKQGGRREWGWGQQNFFAALTDEESCLAPSRDEARARIMPLDYDRSVMADCGYSGWAQLPDGSIYVVSYIVDDAPKGQIRGYRLSESDFCLPSAARRIYIDATA